DSAQTAGRGDARAGRPGRAGVGGRGGGIDAVHQASQLLIGKRLRRDLYFLARADAADVRLVDAAYHVHGADIGNLDQAGALAEGARAGPDDGALFQIFGRHHAVSGGDDGGALKLNEGVGNGDLV